MHSQETAKHTLRILSENYSASVERVSLDFNDPEILQRFLKDPTIERDERIAIWLCQQGYILSAWSLWEYYSETLCLSLPNQVKKERRDSHAAWVARSLEANGKAFPEQAWFQDAGRLRNLIVHSGARIDADEMGRWNELKDTFRTVTLTTDSYLLFDELTVSEFRWKVESFITDHPL